ncbi:hypothetical protein FNF31_01742 [Cafeteria roenbergensis]|uniref:Protein kinase domain-containing protein n=1 Tax=Cafeteria roenbergensis TaxID=33653 RepID=A0A5A8DJZ3_CAFRO|nr:hypothetical protein FNF31_01742 [Cafeteria roenbergensis]
MRPSPHTGVFAEHTAINPTGSRPPPATGAPQWLADPTYRDAFALGCLVHYTLTLGGHPYGEASGGERAARIMLGVPPDTTELLELGTSGSARRHRHSGSRQHGQPSGAGGGAGAGAGDGSVGAEGGSGDGGPDETAQRWRALDRLRLGAIAHEASHMVRCLLRPDPRRRLTPRQACSHVVFWSRAAKFKLLLLVSEGLPVAEARPRRAKGHGTGGRSNKRSDGMVRGGLGPSGAGADGGAGAGGAGGGAGGGGAGGGGDAGSDAGPDTSGALRGNGAMSAEDAAYAADIQATFARQVGGTVWGPLFPPPPGLVAWEEAQAASGGTLYSTPEQYEATFSGFYNFYALVRYCRNLYAHSATLARLGVFESTMAVEDHIADSFPWLFLQLWRIDSRHGNRFQQGIARQAQRGGEPQPKARRAPAARAERDALAAAVSGAGARVPATDAEAPVAAAKAAGDESPKPLVGESGAVLPGADAAPGSGGVYVSAFVPLPGSPAGFRLEPYKEPGAGSAQRGGEAGQRQQHSGKGGGASRDSRRSDAPRGGHMVVTEEQLSARPRRKGRSRSVLGVPLADARRFIESAALAERAAAAGEGVSESDSSSDEGSTRRGRRGGRRGRRTRRR